MYKELMDWFLWIKSQYLSLCRYLPVWRDQDVALKSSSNIVNSRVSSRPFVPLYKLTCDSQLVNSLYNLSILQSFCDIISPSFSNAWSLSSHSFTSISSIANLERTFANTLTRYLYTVDFPVPWRHNFEISTTLCYFQFACRLIRNGIRCARVRGKNYLANLEPSAYEWSATKLGQQTRD